MTLEAVKNCVDRGKKYISIITSGFGKWATMPLRTPSLPTRNRAGQGSWDPISSAFSRRRNCNATFSASKILPGHVAILTQSGALGIAMIGKTAANNLGLSAMVSIGNKADLDEADCSNM
jgi:acyl-CoA synthetase (NDP forming)